MTNHDTPQNKGENASAKPSSQQPDQQTSTEGQKGGVIDWDKISRNSILLFMVIIGIAFFRIIYLFMIPIILAAIFAGLFYPVYKWLWRHLWRKPVPASLVTCLLLVLLIIIPVYITVQLLLNQVSDAFETIIPFFRRLSEEWQDYEFLQNFLKQPLVQRIAGLMDWQQIAQTLAANAAQLSRTVVERTYAGVFGLVFDMLVMLFVLFYFFIDGERILREIKVLLPLRPRYQDLMVTHFVNMSKATLIGTLVVGLVDGILGGITLLIFGIEQWLFWGFIIAVLSILPLVGPTFVLVPAAVFQILSGNIWQGIGILLTTYVIVVNADNIVRPRIVGKSAKMHDLIIFFTTLGGLSVFGITGFLIGPIIASLFFTILEIYKLEFKPSGGGLSK